MGSEFTYTIWYAEHPKGPFLRHNDIRLTDDVIDKLRGFDQPGYYQTAEYNQYTIDGLDSNKSYSVRVIPEDRYDAWWYSQSTYDSLEGGRSAIYTRPTPNGGNRLGFQLYIS